ncbi:MULTISPECIES: glutaredoxin family protein [Oerskovia]|uniref:glutaredoxin family protein n=1 Tax=Oerskovia TaxID=162491 RepID=UPI00296B423C|nr:glutaredoxin family protein [Oerskovia merdavium]
MSTAEPAAGHAAGRDARPDAGPEGLAPAETSGAAPPRVVLYGREGCHLCDAARETVEAVCAEQQVAWAEVDVDADPTGALASEYGDYVPVVTVDGVQQGFWQVDGARLARALARRRVSG